MRLISTLLVLFFSATLSAGTLNKIVVFGDSLSDNGNLYEYMKHQIPMSPPYFSGRFTNGPVWIELLTDSYFPHDGKSHLQDYAFGGAGVSEVIGDDDDDALFTLRREVDTYLLAHQDKADPTSLFVVWIGANNYLAVPENAEKTVENVNLGIKRELDRLANKGAKNIIVVNLPDLGRVPAAHDFDAADALSDLAKQHNDRLKKTVDELQVTQSTVNWIFIDLYQLFNEMLTDHNRYGMSNITDTCYEATLSKPSSRSVLKMVSTVKPQAIKNACDGYLFFDPVHPVARAHRILAEKIREVLDGYGVNLHD